jgi:hypothetical protein
MPTVRRIFNGSILHEQAEVLQAGSERWHVRKQLVQ